MKKRKVYLRKKEGRFIFETKINGQTVHLVGIPTDYYNFLKEMCRLNGNLCADCQKLTKSSFFQRDKWLKIEQILASADYDYGSDEKDKQNIRTMKIIRTQEKDEKKEEDEIEEYLNSIK